ncbi:MAG: AMP-binding protein [Candidatus Brocadia sp.]|uniref:Long-chain-fatty-acid--CoA ligase n=1 Tax=Candidatus Brocadia fulgida TaxID=380242 RepID=A0A0M2UUX0_9BACT|nr:MAG: long-chain-fatty-acid--CoA ligase [Candidatus Brocadia fulgida]UJS19894.1 MAG: AMP-binding protein [Candidatus Brocadia sp.]
MTLITSFLNTCKKYPGKTAILDQNGSLCYEDLRKEVLRYTGRVLSGGAGKNVGILLPNGKEFAAAFYGILATGKTPVPLNFLLSPAQLFYVIRDAEIDTVFTCKLFAPLLGDQIKHLFLVEEGHTDACLNEGSIQYGNAEEQAAMLYTSGTSANPKGVILTHNNFLSNLEGCIHAFHFTEKDILLGILPLFHTYALTTTLILPVCVGATILYLPRFSGPKVLEMIEKHKVTSLFAIPSMYRVLLRTAESTKHDLRTLRLCTSGGEPLPGDVLEAFCKVFPVPLTEGYGLTEATAIVSVNLPEKSEPGSIGPPLDNVEVKIVNDNGQGQPANREGEIWVKGPNVMKGYHKLPKETAETITSDRWLKTGDYGKLDEEGFLWITGRKKELIIISGENVSPTEIEHVISRYEKVFEVAVVGVPDKVRGEVPKAFIALREHATCSEEEIRDYCMTRLPHYKVPKYFVFHRELPHGPTGKILKRALKE